MTDAYGRPIQPKKTNPLVWIGLGCGILFFAFIGFIVFIGVVVIVIDQQDPLWHARSLRFNAHAGA